MSKKNIILGMSIEQYNKKYRNGRHKLLKLTKKQVEDHNEELKNHKWALIDDIYYEIPKPIRLTWFRNLKTSTQIAVCALLIGGITSAIVLPILVMNNKTENIIVSEEVHKYTDINVLTFELGKSLKTEFVLKEDAKENKQLPKKLKKVKTGNVILNEYNPIKNETEPENFFSYTYASREKAYLYIKKVLGPVTIEMNVDDRTYDVTFNPNNEIDESSTIEVKKNNKVSSEQIREIVNTNYRKFKGWYLEKDNEKFNFNSTPITNDITLNARYEKAEKSCVYIKGLKGISETDRYNENLNTAFNKGKAILNGLTSPINEEQFFNTFDDYQIIEIDGKKRYLANLTWYVLGDVTFDTTSDYYLSFGKTHKKLGVNFDFYNTNLIGITEGAKVIAADSFWVMQGSNDDSLDNPLNIENVEINCANKVIACEYGDARFVLNINNCKFDNLMYISQGSKMSIKIKNSIFDVANDSDYALIIERDDYQEVGSKSKEDTVIIENNKFLGTHNYKCLNLNDPYCNKGIINNNLFKDFHTKSISGSKKGNSIIQFSQGVNYEVCNNTFDNCQCNVFMIHEDLPTCTSKVNLLINNNTINNCMYVGVNETGTNEYFNLVSSGNIISGTTLIDECALDNEICKKGQDNEKFIFYINK